MQPSKYGALLARRRLGSAGLLGGLLRGGRLGRFGGLRGAASSPALRWGPAGRALRGEVEGLLERELFGRNVFGQRRVRRAVGDVVAVAAAEQLHWLIGHRRVLERLERLTRRGGTAATTGLGLREQLDGLVE